jgi:DMSO reductase anchor subunit
VFESLFRFFFEYRPVVFQQGEFRFAPTPGSYVAAAIAAVLVILTVVTYRSVRTRGNARPRDRAVLIALRLAALGLVLFCLFRPVLVVKAAVPQQNFLAVLIDDSRSM